MNNNISFWKKYGIKMLLFTTLIFLITYFFFISNGCFPVGADLEKSNWLSFWGGFLSFVGSLFLGAVALWQNEKANDMNKRLLKIEENKRIPFIKISVFDKPERAKLNQNNSYVRFMKSSINQTSKFNMIYFNIENISDVDISSVSLKSFAINGNALDSFVMYNATLNKNSNEKSLVSWEEHKDIPVKTLVSNVRHSNELTFEFITTDYFGVSYLQVIKTKVFLNEYTRNITNSKDYYVLVVNEYDSIKPIVTNEGGN